MIYNIRYILGMMVATVMISSCSNDDALTQGGETDANNGDAILLTIGAPSSVDEQTTSRGSGIVGGIDSLTTKNQWNGETLYIMMSNKENMNLAYFSDKNKANNIAVYGDPSTGLGTPISVQKGVASGLISDANNQKIKYYPSQGSYNFTGYHIDDAIADAAVRTDSVTWLPITIDGSQDILFARGEISDEQKSAADSAAIAQAFSAASSRQGIQPYMNFKHMLTRLTFSIKAGNAEVCGVKNAIINPTLVDTLGIYIDSIRIETADKVMLAVAYNNKAKSLTTAYDHFKASEARRLFPLMTAERDAQGKQKRLEDKTFRLQWDNKKYEGIKKDLAEMIVPTQDTYRLYLYVRQMKPVDDYGGRTVTVKHTLMMLLRTGKLDTNGELLPFKQGSSYNINITLNGLVDNKLKTSLTAWQEGETIYIRPEEAGYDYDENGNFIH